MRTGWNCKDERSEDQRRGSDWGGSVWRVDGVAFGEAREARGVDRGVWARPFAGEQRWRNADYSHGLRPGRVVYALVAAVAGAMEGIFCGHEATAFPRNGCPVDGWKERCAAEGNGGDTEALRRGI